MKYQPLEESIDSIYIRLYNVQRRQVLTVITINSFRADLSGAILKRADLSGALVTPEQLTTTIILQDVYIPDSSKHP